MKYLQAIFSNPTVLAYDQFYLPEYGQNVEAYPFHTVMFAHEAFGDSIRGALANGKGKAKSKGFNEEHSEAREKIMAVADSYSEYRDDESD